MTQGLGGQLSEVPLWMQLPVSTLYKIMTKKRESMEMHKPSSGSDIKYTSQKEAEIAWMKETQPKEVYESINWNKFKV